MTFIDWTGSGDAHEGARFEALQSFMLVALVAHCGMLLGRTDSLGFWATTLYGPAFVASALVGLTSRRARPYCVLAHFAVTTVWLVHAFPVFANHLFLEWSILLFLTLCRGDAALGLEALRWLIVIVLFYSGLQKALVGLYFEGEYLAFEIATTPKFRELLGFLLSDAELGRLLAMGGRTGTGPYSVGDGVFLALSNTVWIAEMGLGLLLIPLKSRRFAFWGALVLMAGIELGAREMIFGCLFVSLLLIFYEGKNALASWPILASLHVLFMLAFHWFPALGLN